MSKIIINLAGNFILVDPNNGAMFENARPHVATPTHFLHSRALVGQVKMLAADLPAEANDKDFAEHWAETVKGMKPDEIAEKGIELAIESYRASFGKPEETESQRKKREKAEKQAKVQQAATAAAKILADAQDAAKKLQDSLVADASDEAKKGVQTAADKILAEAKIAADKLVAEAGK